MQNRTYFELEKRGCLVMACIDMLHEYGVSVRYLECNEDVLYFSLGILVNINEELIMQHHALSDWDDITSLERHLQKYGYKRQPKKTIFLRQLNDKPDDNCRFYYEAEIENMHGEKVRRVYCRYVNTRQLYSCTEYLEPDLPVRMEMFAFV